MAINLDGLVTRSATVATAPVIPSTTQLLQAQGRVLQPGHDQSDLFAVLSDGFWWYAPKNQAEAQPYLEGAQIARAYGLPTQVWLYANVVFRLVTRSRAEWTQALVRHHLQYASQLYHYPEEMALPTQPFTVPIPGQTAYERYEWVFAPMNQFRALIPPQALQALMLVEGYGPPAQAYWVADKVKVQPQARLSVDPLLYGQYGRAFVSLAEWR